MTTGCPVTVERNVEFAALAAPDSQGGLFFKSREALSYFDNPIQFS
jgi:hypothetical protein